jgi:outer membrane receptor for ferrienterochelin and colicin
LLFLFRIILNNFGKKIFALKRNLFLILFFIVFFIDFEAQNLSGVIKDVDNQLPIVGAKITIENSDVWTITNQKGEFSIQLKAKENLIVTKTGYLEKRITYSATTPKNLVVGLQRASIRIQEVALTVRKKHYSEIEIKEEALKNIQAFSLNEVLEQIPGQKLQNLNLNEFKPIVFRSATPRENFVGDVAFGNKSFGTAVVIDGIPVSNNENMQSYSGNANDVFSPNSYGSGFGVGSSGNVLNGYYTNANFGADLRQIPVENIESVEVVQGIPSAKFGDLTSGLININQKSGKTPFRFYTTVREGVQEYNINKGFGLGKNLGFMNVNLNYLKSNSEPRTQFNVYERVSGNVMWTWYNKNKNISNSVSLDLGNNLDNANFEEEDTDMRVIRNKKRDFRISNRFNWRFKESFFDNLAINLNYSSSYQNSYESKLVNVGGEIIGTSLVEGVYTGVYTPVSYQQIKEVEGKPISMFFSAELKKKFKTNNWNHFLVLGTSVRSSDNKGRGRLGAPENILNFYGFGAGNGGQSFRPYNFGENIRAEYQYSIYAEDNIFRVFGKNIFNFNGGVRYDNQFGSSVIQPRINTYFTFNNKFKIRAGFGIASKAPSINQIYTGPRYYDIALADVRLPGYYNLGIVQTFIDSQNNENLKPSKSIRSEIGFDYRLKNGNIGITFYNNKLYDGFANQNFIVKRDLAQVGIIYNGTQTPSYNILGYSDYFYTQNSIVNALKSTDKGVELLANFRKLPLRNLSLDINGSYTETTNNINVERLYSTKDLAKNEVYGIYKPYEKFFKNLNVGFIVNYHLPKVGLVISLRTQHFIVEEKEHGDPNLLIGFVDKDLNKTYITQEQSSDLNYLPHLRASFSEYDYQINKIYHNLNLKVSKDFLNGFKFSFYANNFLDLKQTHLNLENGKWVTEVKPDLLTLSFGAKIEYEF